MYVRVSSNEQVIGFSLDNQEKFAESFRKKMNIVCLEYLEKRVNQLKQQTELNFN